MKKLTLALALLIFTAPFAANAAAGATCTTDADCASGTETCNVELSECELTPAVAQAAAPQTPAATPSAPSTQSSQAGFVPLAPIPNLTQGVTADQAGLANFLNNLYKFLIGLAAVIAIIQIIRGGFEIATSDAIGSHNEGRAHIEQALLGLLLILSPVIVFSLINPAILNLGVNFPAITLNNSSPQTPATTLNPVTGHHETPAKLYKCTTANCSQEVSTCQKNTPPSPFTYSTDIVCVNSGGSIDPNGRTDNPINPFSAYACQFGETLEVNCSYVEP